MNTPKLRSELDLIIILVVSAAVLALLFIPAISATVIRSIIATLFLLFVPGYSFIAALVPVRDSINGLTRFALSLGMSVAFIPTIAAVLNVTWGIQAESLAMCTIFITVICTSITYWRRGALPNEKRFSLNVNAIRSLRQTVFPERESGIDRKLTAVVVAMALLSIPTIAYAATCVKPTQAYTELFITSSNGTLTGYPTDLKLGEQKNVTVNIVNHEGRDMKYTLTTTINNGTNTEVMDSKNVTLAADQMWRENVTLKPKAAGTHMEIAFLLSQATIASPYREVHMWVNVTRPPQLHRD